MIQKRDMVAATRSILKRYALILIGVGLGAVAGYLYYHFVGCASGSCAITSSPVNSTLYGAVMGGLLLNIFRTKN
jgi:phage shock protein E